MLLLPTHSFILCISMWTINSRNNSTNYHSALIFHSGKVHQTINSFRQHCLRTIINLWLSIYRIGSITSVMRHFKRATDKISLPKGGHVSSLHFDRETIACGDETSVVRNLACPHPVRSIHPQLNSAVYIQGGSTSVYTNNLHNHPWNKCISQNIFFLAFMHYVSVHIKYRVQGLMNALIGVYNYVSDFYQHQSRACAGGALWIYFG